MMSRNSRQYREMRVNNKVKDIISKKCKENSKDGQYALKDGDMLDIILECEKNGIQITKKELDKYLTTGEEKGTEAFAMHDTIKEFPCSYCDQTGDVRLMRLTTKSTISPHFSTFICKECAMKLSKMLNAYVDGSLPEGKS